MYIDYKKQIRCRYDVNAQKESFRWLPMREICSELGLVVDGMTTRRAALNNTLSALGFKRTKKGGTWHYLVPCAPCNKGSRRSRISPVQKMTAQTRGEADYSLKRSPE